MQRIKSLKCNAIHSVSLRRVVIPVLAAGLLAAVSGCESTAAPPTGGKQQPPKSPPAPPEPAPTATPYRAPLTEKEQTEVRELLSRAGHAIEEDHLTYPSKGSALALYDKVVILDPDNDEARRGLERVVERYLELAESAAERRRFSNAHAMLDRARLVDPSHPGITPAAQRLALLERARRQLVALDGESLRRHDPAVAEQLHRAGVASRAEGCRANITARNDAEGRWIYQQMSEAPGDERIAARLALGSPPGVEILCFPEDP